MCVRYIVPPPQGWLHGVHSVHSLEFQKQHGLSGHTETASNPRFQSPMYWRSKEAWFSNSEGIPSQDCSKSSVIVIACFTSSEATAPESILLVAVINSFARENQRFSFSLCIIVSNVSRPTSLQLLLQLNRKFSLPDGHGILYGDVCCELNH